MKPMPTCRNSIAALFAVAVMAAGTAQAQDSNAAGAAVDVGGNVPDAGAIKEGLFPEDACKELQANGFRCMGVKPAIRYSLPASSFRLGSAELPDLLKRQLDVFADVLGSKRGTGRKVRIVGHADASGTQEGNQTLSLRRAEAVRGYLVDKGADAKMLIVAGAGAKDLKNAKDPLSGENRRVEIGREN